MLNNDQKYRGSKTVPWSVIEDVDKYNTSRMIEIIRTHGFPSHYRVRFLDSFLMPYIILVHAPKPYFDTLRFLLKQEKDSGRIASFEYNHVLWHLNGRVGVPEE